MFPRFDISYRSYHSPYSFSLFIVWILFVHRLWHPSDAYLILAPLRSSFRSRIPWKHSHSIRWNHDNQGRTSSIIRYNQSIRNKKSRQDYHRIITRSTLFMDPAISSILSGSLAGAIGVGVAFPLDTLKTKEQILGRQQQYQRSVSNITLTSSDFSQLSTIRLIQTIYRLEGISGFFGGVRGAMIGQAIIKSVAFSSNSMALGIVHMKFPTYDNVWILLMAACFSGFVTSFLVAPIERVKVLMQATGNSVYQNEWDCVRTIVRKEGLGGLFSRGLGTTLIREIPSYGLYFWVYGLLIKSPMALTLGNNLSPLVFGAISGMACWIPVYPVDVVKTLVQNTDGGSNPSNQNGDLDTRSLPAWEVAKQLYRDGGIGAFFDGLTPKMIRAAVNHAVCFYIYDLSMEFLLHGR